MAGTTGLEPATSAVTGQRSNQLSYVPKIGQTNWLRGISNQSLHNFLSFQHFTAADSIYPIWATSNEHQKSLPQQHNRVYQIKLDSRPGSTVTPRAIA
jgi:hypothetical protein